MSRIFRFHRFAPPGLMHRLVSKLAALAPYHKFYKNAVVLGGRGAARVVVHLSSSRRSDVASDGSSNVDRAVLEVRGCLDRGMLDLAGEHGGVGNEIVKYLWERENKPILEIIKYRIQCTT